MRALKLIILLYLLCFTFIFAAGGTVKVENHPPALLNVFYFVGPVVIPPPVIITTDESDELGIYFQYEDEDCNISGGHFYVRQVEPQETDWEDLGVLPDGLGCSSVEEGIIFGFGFDGLLEPNYYLGETKWTDVLGAESNVIQWEFTVIEDDDDDDDTNDDTDDDITDDDDTGNDDTDGDSDDDTNAIEDSGGGGGCGCQI